MPRTAEHLKEKGKATRFQKGTSGNPGGKPKPQVKAQGKVRPKWEIEEPVGCLPWPEGREAELGALIDVRRLCGEMPKEGCNRAHVHWFRLYWRDVRSLDRNEERLRAAIRMEGKEVAEEGKGVDEGLEGALRLLAGIEERLSKGADDGTQAA